MSVCWYIRVEWGMNAVITLERLLNEYKGTDFLKRFHCTW